MSTTTRGDAHHPRHCVRDAVAAADGDGDDKVTEATAAIARLLR